MIFNGLQFGLAIAVLLAVIVVLVVTHFLTIKYTRVLVPSVLFWAALADNTHTVRWKGRFRFWVILLFLTFIASVFILALMEPGVSRAGKNTVIIIDSSRLMSEQGSDGSIPLEFAKEFCLSCIKSASNSDKITVIAVDDLPHVLFNSTDARLAAKNAVARLSGSREEVPYGMELAVVMADNIARGDTNCIVQVISAVDIKPFVTSLPTARQFCQFNPVSGSLLISPEYKTKTKVYLSDNIPDPLELLLKVASGVEMVFDKTQADLLVTADSNDILLGKPAIVIADSSLTDPGHGEICFSPFFARHLELTGQSRLAVDLFAPGVGISPLLTGPEVKYLLTDSQNVVWSYLYNDKVIILAESLFCQESNFWKQPQFIPIMSAMFELIDRPDLFIGRASSFIPAQAGGVLVGTGEGYWFDIVELLIAAALVLLLLELFLFCRGKII